MEMNKNPEGAEEAITKPGHLGAHLEFPVHYSYKGGTSYGIRTAVNLSPSHMVRIPDIDFVWFDTIWNTCIVTTTFPLHCL